jgi:hypothetical protein
MSDSPAAGITYRHRVQPSLILLRLHCHRTISSRSHRHPLHAAVYPCVHCRPACPDGLAIFPCVFFLAGYFSESGLSEPKYTESHDAPREERLTVNGHWGGAEHASFPALASTFFSLNHACQRRRLTGLCVPLLPKPNCHLPIPFLRSSAGSSLQMTSARFPPGDARGRMPSK